MRICLWNEPARRRRYEILARDRLSVNAAAYNLGVSAAAGYGDSYGEVTAIGTDGLLPRTEGKAKLGEVEHVDISLHSRDLLRSDGSVRRVQLAGWAAADDSHRAYR